MPSACYITDVSPVTAQAMAMPFRALLDQGKGLALYNGMTQTELSSLEDALWRDISDSEQRLAVALRFRALLKAFASRRLKSLLLERGFKVIVAALAVASTERLNTRFGFRTQHLVMRITQATQPHAPSVNAEPIRLAA